MSSSELYDQVHILAFNRPDYLAQVLEALAPQLSKAPPGTSVHAWIDGYEGSRDQDRGLADRRAEVTRLLEKHLPQARLHKLSTNVGIARIYAKAERLSLREGHAPYALFFEDDYEPGPDYLRGLEQLMRWGLKHPEVAIVTSHGIVAEYAMSLMVDQKYQLPPRPLFVHSLWAFAIKRTHLIERAPYLRDYLSTMRGIRYWKRDNEAIRTFHGSQGMSFIYGTSQDYAKHAALLLHERLAITLPLRLGRYIGRRGEHTNDNIFERLNYDKLTPQAFDSQLYANALHTPLDPALLRWSRVIEMLLIPAHDAKHQLEATRMELDCYINHFQAKSSGKSGLSDALRRLISRLRS